MQFVFFSGSYLFSWIEWPVEDRIRDWQEYHQRSQNQLQKSLIICYESRAKFSIRSTRSRLNILSSTKVNTNTDTSSMSNVTAPISANVAEVQNASAAEAFNGNEIKQEPVQILFFNDISEDHCYIVAKPKDSTPSKTVANCVPTATAFKGKKFYPNPFLNGTFWQKKRKIHCTTTDATAPANLAKFLYHKGQKQERQSN